MPIRSTEFSCAFSLTLFRCCRFNAVFVRRHSARFWPQVSRGVSSLSLVYLERNTSFL